jgi:hypothetical protein
MFCSLVFLWLATAGGTLGKYVLPCWWEAFNGRRFFVTACYRVA